MSSKGKTLVIVEGQRAADLANQHLADENTVYTSPYGHLTGYRFDKIVILTKLVCKEHFKEAFATCLSPQGKIIRV